MTGRNRISHILSLVGIIAAATFVASPAPAGAAEACPNELVRAQEGASQLPDCRAWEMVSPVEKNGGSILGIGGYVLGPSQSGSKPAEGGLVQAAENGEAITYVSFGSFVSPKGATLYSAYISRREAAGWSTENIMAPMTSHGYILAGSGSPYQAFSADLSHSLMVNGTYVPVESPPLTKGAPPLYENYYLRDDTPGLLEPFSSVLTSTPEISPEEFELSLVGVSPDLAHVVFSSATALTPGATNNPNGGRRGNIYEWSAGGRFEAVNVPPGVTKGETTLESELGALRTGGEHAISDDGSRIYWTNPAAAQEKELYLRETGNGGPRTVQVDVSEAGAADPGGDGEFLSASSDGSRAFFTDKNRLTRNSTANKRNCFYCGSEREDDLYEFNAITGRLTDLTVDNNIADVEGASVQGMLGASEDGSYVYFVARGALVSEANREGHLPISGDDNLYLTANGRTHFIATLSPNDNSLGKPEYGSAIDWFPQEQGGRTVRVSTDGHALVFMSDASLTGYDNTDAVTGQPDEEVYEYDALSEALTCVSCNPSGTRPQGFSGIPAGTPQSLEKAFYQSHVLSDDGERVFFNSQDALVPRDTNGHQDVYEYTRGHVYLVSGGAGSSGSAFMDADPKGENVFFITGEALAPQDTDQFVDLYDARVGGGFAQVAAPVCSGTGCQGVALVPPIFATPASATFAGGGNYLAPSTPASSPKKAHKPKGPGRKRRRRKGTGRSVKGQRRSDRRGK